MQTAGFSAETNSAAGAFEVYRQRDFEVRSGLRRAWRSPDVKPKAAEDRPPSGVEVTAEAARVEPECAS
jgi:hypothetical protein